MESGLGPVLGPVLLFLLAFSSVQNVHAVNYVATGSPFLLECYHDDLEHIAGFEWWFNKTKIYRHVDGKPDWVREDYVGRIHYPSEINKPGNYSVVVKSTAADGGKYNCLILRKTSKYEMEKAKDAFYPDDFTPIVRIVSFVTECLTGGPLATCEVLNADPASITWTFPDESPAYTFSVVTVNRTSNLTVNPLPERFIGQNVTCVIRLRFKDGMKAFSTSEPMKLVRPNGTFPATNASVLITYGNPDLMQPLKFTCWGIGHPMPTVSWHLGDRLLDTKAPNLTLFQEHYANQTIACTVANEYGKSVTKFMIIRNAEYHVGLLPITQAGKPGPDPSEDASVYVTYGDATCDECKRCQQKQEKEDAEALDIINKMEEDQKREKAKRCEEERAKNRAPSTPSSPALSRPGAKRRSEVGMVTEWMGVGLWVTMIVFMLCILLKRLFKQREASPERERLLKR